jgi:ABC-type lipoprotein export system ATPase subunit
MRLKSISLDQFRCFKERTEFRMAPITILIGPNGSGKSSVLKGLQLLQSNAFRNNLVDLAFSDSSHRLGSFSSSVSRSSDEDRIGLALTFGAKVHPPVGFDISGDQHFDFQPLQEEASICFEMTYGPHPHKDSEHALLECLRLSIDNHLVFRCGVKPHRESLTIDVPDSPNPLEFEEFPLRQWGEYNGHWFVNQLDSPVSDLGMERFADTSNDLDRAVQKLSEVLTIEENQTYTKSLLSIVEFVERTTPSIDGLGAVGPALDSHLRRIVSELYKPYVLRWIEHLLDFLRVHLRHISDETSMPKRVYTSDQTNEKFYRGLDRLINVEDQPRSPFLTNMMGECQPWLKEFGIGSQFAIQKVAAGAYRPLVVRDSEEYELVDLGKGHAQLIPLILAVVQQKERADTLFVEEPETNLHPNLQAKLADLLVDAIQNQDENENRGQVIVETHSEYLVRRLQYLVARKDVDAEDVLIYYIGTGPDSEDYIRQIEIDAYGQLSEPFGSGFFDQATDLMVDLFKYGSEN